MTLRGQLDRVFEATADTAISVLRRVQGDPWVHAWQQGYDTGIHDAGLLIDSSTALRNERNTMTTETTPAFSVGDRVRVTGDNGEMGHDFTVGDVARVDEVDTSDDTYLLVGVEDGLFNWVAFCDVEAADAVPDELKFQPAVGDVLVITGTGTNDWNHYIPLGTRVVVEETDVDDTVLVRREDRGEILVSYGCECCDTAGESTRWVHVDDVAPAPTEPAAVAKVGDTVTITESIYGAAPGTKATVVEVAKPGRDFVYDLDLGEGKPVYAYYDREFTVDDEAATEPQPDPECPPATFNVGDRVRVTGNGSSGDGVVSHCFPVGAEGVIVEGLEGDDYRVDGPSPYSDRTIPQWVNAGHLELVEPSTPRGYKVGDRVRFTGQSTADRVGPVVFVGTGEEGEVVNVPSGDSDSYVVRFDNGGIYGTKGPTDQFVNPAHLELVTDEPKAPAPTLLPIGTTVRVTGDSAGWHHDFEAGTRGVVRYYSDNGLGGDEGYCIESLHDEGETWNVHPDDVEFLSATLPPNEGIVWATDNDEDDDDDDDVTYTLTEKGKRLLALRDAAEILRGPSESALDAHSLIALAQYIEHGE